MPLHICLLCTVMKDAHAPSQPSLETAPRYCKCESFALYATLSDRAIFGKGAMSAAALITCSATGVSCRLSNVDAAETVSGTRLRLMTNHADLVAIEISEIRTVIIRVIFHANAWRSFACCAIIRR